MATATKATVTIIGATMRVGVATGTAIREDPAATAAPVLDRTATTGVTTGTALHFLRPAGEGPVAPVVAAAVREAAVVGVTEDPLDHLCRPATDLIVPGVDLLHRPTVEDGVLRQSRGRTRWADRAEAVEAEGVTTIGATTAHRTVLLEEMLRLRG